MGGMFDYSAEHGLKNTKQQKRVWSMMSFFAFPKEKVQKRKRKEQIKLRIYLPTVNCNC